MPLSGDILNKGNSNNVKTPSLFKLPESEKPTRPNSGEEVIFAAPWSQYKHQCYPTNTVITSDTRNYPKFIKLVICYADKARGKM